MSEAARLTLERSRSQADEAAAEQKDRATVPALLSTHHPRLAERIAVTEAKQRPGAPALTLSAWRTVKAMCGR